MKKDLVSIIMLCHNKIEFTKQAMDSIDMFTDDWPFEFILVDNGSTDGTQEFIKNSKYKMNGQYIRNESNLGFDVANNQGAKAAKGNFLCFMNNDIIAKDKWLSPLMEVFGEEKAVGVVGPKLLHPGKGTIQHAGVIEHPSGLPDHVYFNMPGDYPPANERRNIFAVTGACFLTPKALFEQLGGFDEAYYNGWEDIDYCQKVHQIGMNIIYEPKSVLYHYESRTDGRYVSEGSNFTLYMSRWVLGKNDKI